MVVIEGFTSVTITSTSTDLNSTISISGTFEGFSASQLAQEFAARCTIHVGSTTVTATNFAPNPAGTFTAEYTASAAGNTYIDYSYNTDRDDGVATNLQSNTISITAPAVFPQAVQAGSPKYLLTSISPDTALAVGTQYTIIVSCDYLQEAPISNAYYTIQDSTGDNWGTALISQWTLLGTTENISTHQCTFTPTSCISGYTPVVGDTVWCVWTKEYYDSIVNEIPTDPLVVGTNTISSTTSIASTDDVAFSVNIKTTTLSLTGAAAVLQAPTLNLTSATGTTTVNITGVLNVNGSPVGQGTHANPFIASSLAVSTSVSNGVYVGTFTGGPTGFSGRGMMTKTSDGTNHYLTFVDSACRFFTMVL